MEFKCRAWDKVNKRMLHFNSLEWLDEYDVWYLEGDRGDVPCEDNIELMLSTNKTDKNKIELYESDIVKHRNGFIYVIEFSTVNLRWCLVQPRLADGTMLGGAYTGGINGQEMKLHMCEKLGNAWENPELLKGGNNA